jgi:hypothetical protein
VADRLIALGFLDDVLDQLPLPALAGGLRRVLADKLNAADAAEEGSPSPAASAPAGAGRTGGRT